MNYGRPARKIFTVTAVLLAVMLLSAQPAAAQEKRFLVRYDHGTANLPAWAGLKLYVGMDRVRIFAGNELVHDIPAGNITSVTHELRAPFDPAKTTEQVFNDTVGACSNVLDCAVLAPAGVVGATGVGIATLFTPKEQIITLNWVEGGQPQQLAMKIAWYQKDFILGALEKATGRAASERLPGIAAPKQPPSAKAPGVQVSVLAQPLAATPAAPELSAAIRLAQPAVQLPPPAAAPEMLQRFELILDRPARLGESTLPAGFYLVLVQERMNGKAMVVFLDDVVKDAQTTRIVAKALADASAAPGNADLQPIFSGEGDPVILSEIRLPGRTLKFGF